MTETPGSHIGVGTSFEARLPVAVVAREVEQRERVEGSAWLLTKNLGGAVAP